MSSEHIPATLEAALAVIAQQQTVIAQLQSEQATWRRLLVHDLRAPMRHVVSFAPLLQESVQELAAAAPLAVDAAQDAREFSDIMAQAARKMSAMLESLANAAPAPSPSSAPASLRSGVEWSALATPLQAEQATRNNQA